MNYRYPFKDSSNQRSTPTNMFAREQRRDPSGNRTSIFESLPRRPQTRENSRNARLRSPSFNPLSSQYIPCHTFFHLRKKCSQNCPFSHKIKDNNEDSRETCKLCKPCHNLFHSKLKECKNENCPYLHNKEANTKESRDECEICLNGDGSDKKSILCHNKFHLNLCKNSNCEYSHDARNIDIKKSREECAICNNNIPCHEKFHENGCSNKNCPFSHDPIDDNDISRQNCHKCKKIDDRRSIPCHFYLHLKKCDNGRDCEYSHNKSDDRPDFDCPLCIPCHFYHLNEKHDAECEFSHRGKPAGKCIRDKCPVCYVIAQKKPCHYYHKTGACSTISCGYSHYGEPTGKCFINDCILCKREKSQQDLNTVEYRTLELPSWAAKKFYGTYFLKISKKFLNVELKTFPNLVILSFRKGLTYGDEIREYWTQISAEFIENIHKSSWVYNIPGTEISAIIRNGLEITDILFPEDYINIKFVYDEAEELTNEAIYDLINVTKDKVEEIIRITSQEHILKFFIVKFMSKTIAKECYKELKKNPKKGLKCSPQNCMYSQERLQASVLIRFSPYKSQGEAVITYSNKTSPEEFIKKMKTRGNQIDGQLVKLEANKNTVVISGLNPYTNEFKLQEISKMFDEIPEIKIKRHSIQNVANIKGYPPELKIYEHKIIQIIKLKATEFPAVYELKIDFKMPEFAYEFVKTLKTIYNYPCPDITIRYKHVMFVNKKIYREILAHKETLSEKLMDIYDPKIKIKNPTSNLTPEKELKYSVSRDFNIEEVDVSHDKLLEEFSTIPDFIKSMITRPNMQFNLKDDSVNIAFSQSMMNYYRELEREPKFEEKLMIFCDPISRTLNVYAYEHDLAIKAEDRIRNHIEKLKNSNSKKIFSLIGYNIRLFRNKLRQKNRLQQLEWVHIDNRKNLKILTDDPEAIKIIKSALEESKKSDQKQEEQKIGNDDNKESCSICFEDNITFYRGINCSHNFCHDCLGNYFTEASRKTSILLKCPYPSCTAKFNPYDIFELADSQVIQKLITRHLSSYIMANKGQYIYCKNNCPNIFKVPRPNEKIPELLCTCCKTSYCSNELYPLHQKSEHEYGRCPINQELKLQLESQGYKELKCCGQMAEKPDGCQKVHCICSKYSCWICLTVFSDQDESYNHLIQKHGGIHQEGEINDFEKRGMKILRCCGNLAEKNGGCNKVICTLCKKANCWICLEYFTEGLDCYRHLREKHGGLF